MRSVIVLLALAALILSSFTMMVIGSDEEVKVEISHPEPVVDTPTTRNNGLYNGKIHYDDVMVVVNENSTISTTIGDYFAAARGIPEERICNITVQTGQTINRAQFNQLKAQVKLYMAQNNLTDKINYIVTTKGVPLRVSGGSQDRASLDAELTMINGPMEGQIGSSGWSNNPYAGANEPFSRAKYGIYLVTRLTGYNLTHALGLINNATISYGTRGLFVLDVDPGRDGSPGYKIANDWMRAAAPILEEKGFDVLLNENNTYVTKQENVTGYSSWGSNDGHDHQYTDHAKPYNTWVPGAIAETFVSTGGRSFAWPPSYGQSLIADWINEGVTGIKGYVYEPYLSACCRSQILFDRYTDGYYLAESFYASSPFVGWMGVICGDPKVASYYDRLPDLTVEEADIDVDPNPVVQRNEVTVRFGVTNAGIMDITNLHVQVNVLDDQDQVEQTMDVYLDVNNTDTNWTEVVFDTDDMLGLYDIEIVIDPGVLTREIDRSDNVDTIILDVLGRPKVLAAWPESTEVYRGETIGITLDLEDAEDIVTTLVPAGEYSLDSVNWTALPAASYNENWTLQFTPAYNMTLGDYSFRFNVTDSDSVLSFPYIANWTITVLNNGPLVNSVRFLGSALYRGSTATAQVNTTDLESDPADLDCTIRYSYNNATWYDVYDVYLNGTLFEADIEIPSSIDSDKLYLMIDITDPDGGFSPTVYSTGGMLILNNAPTITSVTLDQATANRGDKVTFDVIAADVEDYFYELTCHGEWRANGSTDWQSLKVGTFDATEDAIVMEFTVPAGTTVGLIDARFRVTDTDNEYSDWFETDGPVVVNIAPVVNDLECNATTTRSSDHGLIITFIDADSSPGSVMVDLELALAGTDQWVAGTTDVVVTSGSTFILTIPASLEVGLYDVRVALKDGDMTAYGGWTEFDGLFTVENVLPLVTDVSYSVVVEGDELKFTIDMTLDDPDGNIVSSLVGYNIQGGPMAGENGTYAANKVTSGTKYTHQLVFSIPVVRASIDRTSTVSANITMQDNDGGKVTKFLFQDVVTIEGSGGDLPDGEVSDAWKDNGDDTTDTDSDGLPDWWEEEQGLDPDNSSDAEPAIVDQFDDEKEQYDDWKANQASEGDFPWVIVIIVIICVLVLLALIIVAVIMVARPKGKEEPPGEDKKEEEAELPPPPPPAQLTEGEVGPDGPPPEPETEAPEQDDLEVSEEEEEEPLEEDVPEEDFHPPPDNEMDLPAHEEELDEDTTGIDWDL